MRAIIVVLFGILVAAACAVAGEVYGTINDGKKPVISGVKVEIEASGKVFSGETDKFGSYRIYVKEKGKCTLTVHLKEQSPSVSLFSYDKATRYDWVLETKEGTLSLRRK